MRDGLANEAWEGEMFDMRHGALSLLLLAMLALGTMTACVYSEPSLGGAWTGEDPSGEDVTLVFGNNDSLEIVDSSGEDALWSAGSGARVEYAAVAEVDPKQLCLKFFRDDELLAKVPFGIYKFKGRTLVICQAKEYQRTLGLIPVGPPRYEFPENFTGCCFSLDRRGWGW